MVAAVSPSSRVQVLRFVALALRYGLAGVANTALGLGVTVASDILFHVPPWAANVLGYCAGWILSYVLNRTFVFRDRAPAKVTGTRYLFAIALAFATNQLVLFGALRLAPPTPLGHLLSQFLGMATYTVAMFGLCTAWVFRHRGPTTEASS